MHNQTIGISTPSRAVGQLLCALISVIAGIGLAAANSSAQTNETLLYAASAYGTYATVGSVVSVGKTAPVMISTQCGTAQVGVSKTGTSAAVSDPPLVSTGATNTSASSALDVATSSSTVASLNLLFGLVTADAVTAVSTTSVSSQGAFQESGAGSSFTNLVVAGIPQNSTPPPNTTIPLVGFGTVVLNQQITVQTSTSAHLTVNMINISITLPNILGIPVGTKLIVADAYSSLLEVGAPAALGGEAYGTQIIGKLVSSSPTAPAIEPCTGTGGTTITKTLTGVSIPLIVTSGTITDTAEGTATSALTSGQTADTIQGVNLLSGIVTADVIQDQANGSTTDGTNLTLTTSGSFTNIMVVGQPQINDNVPPNTKVTLAGFGTLWLHRVITTSDSIEIRMLEIQITEANVLGLPIGADIRVCDSSIALLSANNP